MSIKRATVTSDFDARIVLVTGAGSGIGREAACAFAERGAIVYCVGLHDRRQVCHNHSLYT